jgi:EAL domain-containing protein (putative c-di-GMP-specific phosphodiesterase class I)
VRRGFHRAKLTVPLPGQSRGRASRGARLTIIAEGVETVEQEAFLRNHSCAEMQGFLFSKPLSPREMATAQFRDQA